MEILQFTLEYRDVLLAVLCFFGAAFIWRYLDRKPYVKAALFEDFKLEMFPGDLFFDESGNLPFFESRMYRLVLTIYPTKCRSVLRKITASSGRLCPVGEWMYQDGAERTRSLNTWIVIDPADIAPKPIVVEFQFLPDSDDASAVSFTMRLERYLFPTVRVYVDFVGKRQQEKQEDDRKVNPRPVVAIPISDKRVLDAIDKMLRRASHTGDRRR